MPNPYPDRDFANDRERWEEYQASFYEQCIDELVKGLSVHLERATATVRLGLLNLGYVNLHTAAAHDIAMRINAYAQMAGNLRQPRISRIESDRRG